MQNTPSSSRANHFMGELDTWMRQHANDNSEQLSRLKRSLRIARSQELTPRQSQMLTMYYDQKMSMPQIAEELGISASAVSRTLSRARHTLYRCLRYAL